MKAKRILASVLSAALLLQLSPLGVLALDESLPQTPQVSTVQENLDPVPTAEPAPTEEPAPTAEPIPEETAVPMAAPTPEPTAEPTAAPAADAEDTPAPVPSAEPTAAPDPAAAVQAMIDALPDEVTEDNAEAVEQALTDIDDAKESLTDDELAGLDFARYDTAANALLALWGEAPADAVETLDNYAQPGIDATDGYYQITTEGELRWFAEAVNNGDTSSNARLMNDITINSKVLSDDGSLISDPSSLKSWTPIGTDADGMRFTGTFDGQNHTITGLYIDGTADYVGLFGCVGVNGKVINVTVADSYVSGNSDVGGICGLNTGGTLQGCHNIGTVSGASHVGGVCGINKNSGTIQKCDNAGTVSGTEFFVGGVCGTNDDSATLEKSYNTGDVSGNSYVGGVCGLNGGNGTVNGCYNTGTVRGSYSGSVCGSNYSTVQNCYYLGGTNSKAFGSGTGANCKSKNNLQFQNGDVAFCLQNDLGQNAEPVWGQRIGTDKTPVLSSETDYKVYHPTSGTSPCTGGYNNTGDGTLAHKYENSACIYCGEPEPPKDVEGYYQIINQWQLRWFAKEVNNGRTDINARLMNDITMDSTEWTPIGTSNEHPFKGTFDGNGHTISKLTCTDAGAEYVGLVGYASGAIIQNVTVKDSSFVGERYIGAVCGSIKDGTITGCTNSGSTVSGNYYLGGIVGQAYTVQRCGIAAIPAL